MIKCNVTINGTVSRPATVRTSSDGREFTCFTVKTTIPAKSGAGKQVEVSVSMDGQGTAPITVGARIGMQGTLTFRKRGEALYLNFHADTLDTSPSQDKDAITGSIEFRGTVGRQVEEKTDKKGCKYLVFSAFSTEKDGETFAFTWVRFIRFSAEKEAFLAPRSGVIAKGKLELSTYLDKINIGCRVEELNEWVKQENHNRTQE